MFVLSRKEGEHKILKKDKDTLFKKNAKKGRKIQNVEKKKAKKSDTDTSLQAFCLL